MASLGAIMIKLLWPFVKRGQCLKGSWVIWQSRAWFCKNLEVRILRLLSLGDGGRNWDFVSPSASTMGTYPGLGCCWFREEIAKLTGVFSWNVWCYSRLLVTRIRTQAQSSLGMTWIYWKDCWGRCRRYVDGHLGLIRTSSLNVVFLSSSACQPRSFLPCPVVLMAGRRYGHLPCSALRPQLLCSEVIRDRYFSSRNPEWNSESPGRVRCLLHSPGISQVLEMGGSL